MAMPKGILVRRERAFCKEDSRTVQEVGGKFGEREIPEVENAEEEEFSSGLNAAKKLHCLSTEISD